MSAIIESTYSTSSLVGIGVVKAQIAFAAKLLGDAEVEADGFGVADVQIAVWFGREAGVNTAVMLAAVHIFPDHGADEVGWGVVVVHSCLVNGSFSRLVN
jgi:hypothetical protein